ALYEALYGQRPFAGETIAEVRARVLAGAIQEPPGRARVPKRVRRVIMRGLAREPSQRYPDMAELLVALDQLRVPRWASLTPVAGAGLIGLLASLMVFQTSEPSERASEGLCEVEAELAGIWDDARRDALARAFTGTGRAYAGDVAAQVSARLDGYASSWLALRREACVDAWEDTGGELADGGREADDPASTSERTYLTMACLDRGRGELRALGDALLADPEGLIDNAVTAAYRLRALEPCASNPELALRGGGPRSPALQAKLSSIQSRVDELDALLKAGDYRRGLERGQRALEWARDIGHEPTTAEVLYFVGAFAAGARDYEAAERWLFEAAVTAERGDSYEVLARARTELVVVIGYRLGRHDEALRWGAMAGATVDQLGAGGLLETRLLNAVGLVHERRGDLESARAQIERALFVGRRSLGDDHPGVATTLDNLATVLDGLGRRDEELTRARAALALRERVLGPHHPDVAESLRHVAALERPQGDAPAPAP
ncbi:MAG: tetratricopeptide repeat protein, partial [Myxococcales bacterium]|nr:tetratricopeptide repeat protein [Myxococcales bacterium]